MGDPPAAFGFPHRPPRNPLHAPIAALKSVPGGPLGEGAPKGEKDDSLESGRRCLQCATCDAEIAEEGDVFSMSEHDAVSAFVNPAGFVHEIVTLRAAVGLRLVGHGTAEHTWFAGYAWTIANCASCRAHLGWQFDALEGQSPAGFWGLLRTALAGA